MLSKIALGVAHYNLGPDAFAPIAREFITKGEGHPNQFVGGFADSKGAPIAPIAFHSISLWHYDGYLVATIQLFASANTPVNYAVVGTLRHMPPGLPLLPLRPRSQRQNKTPGRPASADPNAAIQWDQIVP